MMLKLLVVGEGERDGAVVPCLAATLLGTPIEAQFERWPRLHGAGRGYTKKLRFAMLQVANRELEGMIGTLDSDDRDTAKHLPRLIEARALARAQGNATPAALGEAIPHLEAWLLDDPVAVRAALGFDSDAEIKSPTKVKSPKDELTTLCSNCKVNQPPIELLRSIAKQLTIFRCNHAKQSGFEQFATDLQQELRPLCSR